MATANESVCNTLRINDLDWLILSIMSDGRRYTPSYLGNDVPELEDYKASYIRRRVNDLYNNELLDRVGNSSMYVISAYGITALRLRANDEITDDLSPRDLRELIYSRTESAASASE